MYFIQKETSPYFTTRMGLDGAWVGVIRHDSYIFVSVAPGEHHACAATQDRKHPGVELVDFTAEAGKVYYFLVRGIADMGNGGFATYGVRRRGSRRSALLDRLRSQSVAQPKQ